MTRPSLLVGAAMVTCLIAAQAAPRAQTGTSWLDRPLVNWNTAGHRIPKPPVNDDESLDEVMKRCRLTPLRSTVAQRAVRSAGWMPFRYFGRELVREDIEMVGGMAGADGMCRPSRFNVFVFAAGRFAGTLSPVAMNSRSDSASGEASIAASGIMVNFNRYSPSDPLCCPSSHVSVRYRIDRTARGPVVVPVSKEPTP